MKARRRWGGKTGGGRVKNGNKKQRISIESNAPFSSGTFGIKKSVKKNFCARKRER
jgi:hypothetical protein